MRLRHVGRGSQADRAPRLVECAVFSDPWRDLAAYGTVETERFLAGFYYVSSVTKAEQP
ncbi:MAG TPA: hypothetical protein VGH58_04115 [Solirubrobacterales bacterium]|jgi:hypothetical protein